MDHERWTQIWEAGQTRWHKTVVEPILEKYLDQLASGQSGISILVTMCGKTVDIPWLCEKGHSVTGVELSPTAVQQLFQENSIPYAMSGEQISAVKLSDVQDCLQLSLRDFGIPQVYQ